MISLSAAVRVLAIADDDGGGRECDNVIIISDYSFIVNKGSTVKRIISLAQSFQRHHFDWGNVKEHCMMGSGNSG